MKKVLKITSFFIISMILLCHLNFVKAGAAVLQGDGGGVGSPAATLQDGLEDLDKYDPSKTRNGTDEQILADKANRIVTIVRNIGIVVAVIALMVIGFKEMTASVQEKPAIKQALPGYLVGVALVIAITMLPTIIYNLTKGL